MPFQVIRPMACRYLVCSCSITVHACHFFFKQRHKDFNHFALKKKKRAVALLSVQREELEMVKCVQQPEKS